MSDSEFIYGRNAVKGILETKPDRVAKIYIKQGSRGSVVDDIRQLASGSKVPFQEVPGTKLFQLVGKVNDQGIVAQISMSTYLEYEEWIENIDVADNPVVLLLDEIEDAHNFGAIIRSAVASGVAGIIVSKHKQAPLNATVFKTSAGTLPLASVIRVTNLSQTLQKLKDDGFWICGLEQESEQTFWEKDLILPLVLVIGNEGKGMRPVTEKNCDFTVSIPMLSSIESLNASVSSALVTYEALRQRQTKSKK